MYQDVGGLYGVSERVRLRELKLGFCSGLSHPGGKKLLSSLAERALMEGWVGSFTVLLALLEQLVRIISRMEWRGALMIFAAVFTVRWRVLRSAALQFPYQTVMHLVSSLSMVPL